MNRRIKKKKDIVRINIMLLKEIVIVDEYRLVYARLVGRKNLRNINSDFWNGYYKWNKSISGHRTWTYILKKNNLPKHICKK